MFNAITGVVRKIVGTRTEREIRKMQPLLDRINQLEAHYKALDDQALAACYHEFRQQAGNGKPLDDLLPDVYAMVREVARRQLGERHYDVQLIGGVVLHQGRIAEMKTGEGKTLVATLPITLNSLSGKGCHVITVNDYLADRDADWMGKIYRFMGMSVGKILSSDRVEESKRAAYHADVTYGTNNEFGFDFLRDNMKFELEGYVQRGHSFAIVDEVDSILIDEARTPLIISGPTRDPVDKYYVVDGVVPVLQNEIDYVIDEKGKTITLTDEGVDKVERKLGLDNLYDPHNMEILHKVDQALKAHMLFKRDRDYVVRGNKVVIVDEHTGRLMTGRRWSDGLHQAIEAKERLEIEPESQTYATITFQNYFRMYQKLAGMTGTAETEAEELMKIYKLEVVAIPTNEPVRRTDHDDVIYKTQMEKFRQVMAEIEDSRERGQPVLVGTTSVEKSEIIHQMLKKKGFHHEVLNAKNHSREADIIAQAGRRGAVTISTNMAGRGTDIKLGGDPVKLAQSEVGPDASPEVYEAALQKAREQCAREREEVLAAGGMHILGTERHESRRIDNQLRGRSGRQGDPGSSRFYLSLEDDLLRIFGGEKITIWMERMGLKDDERIEHRWINKSIENAQKKVEGYNFNIRKTLLEYDDVLNDQRKSVYGLRRRALGGESIRDMVMEAIGNLIDDTMDECCQEGVHPEDWNIPGLKERMLRVFGVQWEEEDDALRDHSQVELRQRMLGEATEVYEAKEEELGEEVIRQVERMLLLQFTDQLWKDHLLAMDRLRDGIGLRGYGQRNPLLEYKKEGFNMFQMMGALRDESVVSRILRMQLSPEVAAAATAPGKRQARQIARGQAPAQPSAQGAAPGGIRGLEAPSVDAEEAMRRLAERQAEAQAQAALAAEQARVAAEAARPAKGLEAKVYGERNGVKRNDPCPCGSGQKFKKCCMNAE
ncbi:MAG: preprotein translocase subunit SecA [Pseudomonadota bacterium]